MQGAIRAGFVAGNDMIGGLVVHIEVHIGGVHVGNVRGGFDVGGDLEVADGFGTESASRHRVPEFNDVAIFLTGRDVAHDKLSGLVRSEGESAGAIETAAGIFKKSGVAAPPDDLRRIAALRRHRGCVP